MDQTPCEFKWHLNTASGTQPGLHCHWESSFTDLTIGLSLPIAQWLLFWIWEGFLFSELNGLRQEKAIFALFLWRASCMLWRSQLGLLACCFCMACGASWHTASVISSFFFLVHLYWRVLGFEHACYMSSLLRVSHYLSTKKIPLLGLMVSKDGRRTPERVKNLFFHCHWKTQKPCIQAPK